MKIDGGCVKSSSDRLVLTSTEFGAMSTGKASWGVNDARRVLWRRDARLRLEPG